MIPNIFSTAENLEKRFWEIDSLRGIAIIMMIVSNFVTDLDYFKITNVNSLSGFWWFFARITAAIFVFLVGVSLTLSYSRSHPLASESPHPLPFFKFLKRGLKIFSWGIIISVVTYLFMGSGFILFGVLHLIGLSIILAYPLLKYRFANLAFGLIIFALGFFVKNIYINIQWLVWLGIPQQSFYSVDYFPLIPWFAAVLFGIFAGNLLYGNGVRKFKLPDPGIMVPIKFLIFLGKNSLLLYLIHQPILILALKLLSG